MASTEIDVIRGDTFEGEINLREIDACDEEKENTYAIPAGSVVELRFPGETTTVVIDSSGAEVTIADYNKGKVTFAMTPANSALLKVGSKQAITLHVKYNAGADRKTFEKAKIFTVADRTNN